MLVYKFGGASVKNAAGIRSLVPLIEKQKSEKLVIVISAMGKMTNAFEVLLDYSREKNALFPIQLQSIKDFHYAIIDELFEGNSAIYVTVEQLFKELLIKLELTNTESYDFAYDQTVCFGELLSSNILSSFFNSKSIVNKYRDASGLLITNEKYRDARINWPKTNQMASNELMHEFKSVDLIITQGFIGGTEAGQRTTLGREGSDFSAAIIANVLDAKELVVWKDVPGILNAHPKYFPLAKRLGHISYHETVELAFYGASVIHPRTLMPLKAKKIPLLVRSFNMPELETIINGDNADDVNTPSFIIKESQILFTIAARDFSFIDAEKLALILKLFSANHFHIRLIQNSALNFSIVADENPLQLSELLSQLQTDYSVKYNRELSLLTVRHYKDDSLSEIFSNTKVLLEMHSRITQQYVITATDMQLKLIQINNLIVN